MIEIVRGEDKNFILKFRDNQGDPFDLNGVTSLKIHLQKQSGGLLTLDLEPIPPKTAKAAYQGIIFESVVSGIVGNGIILRFDGTKSVNQIVNEYNNDNPTKTVKVTASQNINLNSLVLPPSEIKLTGGLDSYQAVKILNPVMGKVEVTLIDTDTEVLKQGVHTLYIDIDFGDPIAGIKKRVIMQDALEVKNFI